MTSDYFLVPTSPDYFSTMAIDSLSDVIPRWSRWSSEAQTNSVLRDAAYPFPQKTPKFLGTVIQKFRPRAGAPTIGFQQWIDSIGARIVNRLRPALADCNMLLADEKYAEAGLGKELCLALIADFNTLIALSQENQTPIYALADSVLGVGVVLEQNELMSILVYGLHDSGGLPADLSLVHSVDKSHAGDDIGELAKAA
jgi:hypothetical protein